MTAFTDVLLVCAAAGLCLVIVTAGAMISRARKENAADADETARKADEAIADVDRAIDEMDKQAKSIFAEMDNKYQELLFLYDMIDGKLDGKAKAAAAGTASAPAQKPKPKANGANPGSTRVNPNRDMIRKLADEGQNPTQIAKSLNMGQGEVQLVLNLERGARA